MSQAAALLDARLVSYAVAPVAGVMEVADAEVVQPSRRRLAAGRAPAGRRLSSEMSVAERANFASPIVDISLKLKASSTHLPHTHTPPPAPPSLPHRRRRSARGPSTAAGPTRRCRSPPSRPQPSSGRRTRLYQRLYPPSTSLYLAASPSTLPMRFASAQVPRLNSSERAALLNFGGGLREYRCASDADCAGLSWDPVLGGVCGDDSRCRCPLPRSGSACQRELSCRWLDDAAGTWRGGGCSLHFGESSAERVACACTRLRASVTAMHELKLKPQCSTGGSLVACALATTSFSALLRLSWNGALTVLLGAVCGVNALWLLLLLASKLLGNEAQLRERNVYYTFWRKAHAHRMTRTWWRRTWMQMKTQHKLLRVLFLRYNVAQDPAALHTGAQKATILAAIVLLKMLLATLFFRPTDNYDNVCVYDCQFADDIIPGTYTEKECEEMGGAPQYGSGKSSRALIIDLVYKSLVTAVCSLPATVFLDQAFWRCQRLTNAHLAAQGPASAECKLMVSAAMRYILHMNDLTKAWFEWVQVLELMRISRIQRRLTQNRLLRYLNRQSAADASASDVLRRQSVARASAQGPSLWDTERGTEATGGKSSRSEQHAGDDSCWTRSEREGPGARPGRDLVTTTTTTTTITTTTTTRTHAEERPAAAVGRAAVEEHQIRKAMARLPQKVRARAYGILERQLSIPSMEDVHAAIKRARSPPPPARAVDHSRQEASATTEVAVFDLDEDEALAHPTAADLGSHAPAGQPRAQPTLERDAPAERPSDTDAEALAESDRPLAAARSSEGRAGLLASRPAPCRRRRRRRRPRAPTTR